MKPALRIGKVENALCKQSLSRLEQLRMASAPAAFNSSDCSMYPGLGCHLLLSEGIGPVLHSHPNASIQRCKLLSLEQMLLRASWPVMSY